MSLSSYCPERWKSHDRGIAVEKNMGRENPGSWEALEYYCGHVCGLINRQHGVCKALCAKRHRMALYVEQVAAEKSRRDRIAKKRKKQRKR